MAVTIFADGASSGNPGPAGWGVIIVDRDQVTELGGGSPNATNNQMELMAVIKALEKIKPFVAVLIHTDSNYVIQGFGSKNEKVANRDLWDKLFEVAKDRKVTWNKILGHSGIPGNERADAIAVSFSKGLSPKLFSGPLADYKIDVKDLSSKTNPKGATYSYLSLVNGIAKRHKTWAECEQRVKGASNAKYKKTTSPAEEEIILKSWGVDLKV